MAVLSAVGLRATVRGRGVAVGVRVFAVLAFAVLQLAAMWVSMQPQFRNI